MHEHPPKSQRPFWFCILVVGLVALGMTPQARGQSPDEGQVGPLMFYPQVMPERALWQSAGLTAVAPPPEITEEMQVRWPAFDFHVLYGLPKGFSVDSRAAVQVLQNRLSMGAKWADRVGEISVSLGWDLAYWFGFLDVGGFDSKAHGWESTPNISIGHKFGDVAAAFKVELLIDHSFTSYQGDNKLEVHSRAYAGWAFTLALEQPFWKDQYLTLGFRAMYTKFYWQTWSLYSTFDRYLFYPEIIVGFIL